MKKSELIESLIYAENERDLLFLENDRLKDEIRKLKQKILDLESKLAQ